MVFGSTYCAVPHLEIEDGDKCILLPLRFRMNSDVDKWNKADINSFMFLYVFIHKPQEVIYEGNISKISYLDKQYGNTLEHELFMLIYYEFYNSIISEYRTFGLEEIRTLKNFRTIRPIWEKAITYE